MIWTTLVDAAKLVRMMVARFDKVLTPELRQAAATGLWRQSLTRWSGSRNRAELMVDIGLGRKIAANYVSGFVILFERSLRIGEVRLGRKLEHLI